MKKTFQSPSLRKSGFVALIVVGTIVLVSILYYGIMESPFQFDDIYNIQENQHIRLKEITSKGLLDAGFKSYASNRPVANITFALNYYFGGYDVFGYHIVNVFIHLFAGLFLFLIVKETVTIARSGSQCMLVTDDTNTNAVAFAVALIWLVHPLATQSVTYMVQRMTSMAALFSVISLYCYVKARIVSDRWGGRILYALSIVSWILALGSKEISITLPLFVFLYEWFFLQNLDRQWLKKRIPIIILVFAAGILAGFLYLGWSPLSSIKAGYIFREFTLEQRVMTEWRIMLMYLGLIFFPYPARLNLDYDFPLSYSFLNPSSTLLALLAIIGLIVTALWIAKRNRIVSFAILWFFGNLVVESTVLSLELVYEHRTYIPSMFVVCAAVLAAHHFLKNKWARVVILCIVVVLFSAWTFQRNLVWKEDLTLWTDILMKSPNKARPHTNYALALMDRGRLDEAIEHYRIAVKLAPNVPAVHYNLAGALLTRGEVDNAIEQYRTALKLDPGNVEFLLGMARAQEKKNRPEEATKYYEQALKLDPGNASANNGIGKALADQGRYDEAMAHFDAILRADPDDAEAYSAMGNVQTMQGDIGEAKRYYLLAIRKKPDYAEAYANLGSALVKVGRLREGTMWLEKAVNMSPDNVPARLGLATVHLKRFMLDKARDQLEYIVRISPSNMDAKQLLEKLMDRRKTLNDAIEGLKISLQRDPRNPDLYFRLGELYRLGGRFNEAIQAYQEALALSPGFIGAHQQIAIVYSMAGEHDKAIRHLEEIMETNPDDPNTYYNIACQYSLQNNTDEAALWLKKAMENGFGNWDLLKTDEDLDAVRSTTFYQEIMKDRN